MHPQAHGIVSFPPCWTTPDEPSSEHSPVQGQSGIGARQGNLYCQRSFGFVGREPTATGSTDVLDRGPYLGAGTYVTLFPYVTSKEDCDLTDRG